MGDECGLAIADACQESDVTILRIREVRVVACEGVVGELAQPVDLAAGCEVLEGPDAQVARGHAREDRTGQRFLSVHQLAGGRGGERAGGRDAEGVHRFADHVLA